MDALITVLEGVSAAQIILMIAALAFIGRVGKKIVDETEKLHQRKDAREEMITIINEHERKICEIESGMKTMEQKIDMNLDESRDYRRISLADKIYRKYAVYVRRGWLTNNEMVNYRMCVDQYIKTIKPGQEKNDLVVTKYALEVQSLKIKVDDVGDEYDIDHILYDDVGGI